MSEIQIPQENYIDNGSDVLRVGDQNSNSPTSGDLFLLDRAPRKTTKEQELRMEFVKSKNAKLQSDQSTTTPESRIVSQVVVGFQTDANMLKTDVDAILSMATKTRSTEGERELQQRLPATSKQVDTLELRIKAARSEDEISAAESQKLLSTVWEMRRTLRAAEGLSSGRQQSGGTVSQELYSIYEGANSAQSELTQADADTDELDNDSNIVDLAEPTDPTSPQTEALALPPQVELAKIPQDVFDSFRAQLYGDDRFGEAFNEVLNDAETAQFFEEEIVTVINHFLKDSDEPDNPRLEDVAILMWGVSIRVAQRWLESASKNPEGEEGDSTTSVSEDIIKQIEAMVDSSFLDNELNDQIDRTKATLLDAWRRQHATPATPAPAAETPSAPEPAEPSPVPESLTPAERAQATLDAFRRDFDLGFIDEQIDSFPPERRAQARVINRLIAAVELRVADLEDDIVNSDETAIQRSHQRLSRQLDNFRTTLQDNRVLLIRPVVAEVTPATPEAGERPSPITEDWVNGYRLLSPMRVGDEGAEENLKHFPKDVVEKLDRLLKQEIDKALENPNYTPDDSLKDQIRTRVYEAAGVYRTSGSVDLSKLDEPTKGEAGKTFNDFIDDATQKINTRVQEAKNQPRVESPTQPPTEDEKVKGWRKLIPPKWRKKSSEEGSSPESPSIPYDEGSLIAKATDAVNNSRLNKGKRNRLAWFLAGLGSGALGAYAGNSSVDRALMLGGSSLAVINTLLWVKIRADVLASNQERAGNEKRAKALIFLSDACKFVLNNSDRAASYFAGVAGGAGMQMAGEFVRDNVPSLVAATEPAQAAARPDQPAAAELPAPTGKTNIDLDNPALGTLNEEPSAVPQKEPVAVHLPDGGRDTGAPDVTSLPSAENHFLTPERTHTVQEGDFLERIARDVDVTDAGVSAHGGIVDNSDGSQSYSAGINETDIILANQDLLVENGANPDDLKQIEDLSIKLDGFVTRQDLMDNDLMEVYERVSGTLKPGMELTIPSVDFGRTPAEDSAAFKLPQVAREVDVMKAAKPKP